MAKILQFPDRNKLTDDDLAILIRASIIWLKRCRDNAKPCAILSPVSTGNEPYLLEVCGYLGGRFYYRIKRSQAVWHTTKRDANGDSFLTQSTQLPI